MYFKKVLKLWILISIIFLLSSHSLIAQNNSHKTVAELYNEFDSKYGLDPNLYKGIKYYYSHGSKNSYPFWRFEKPIIGKVLINNILYDSVLLCYDLYLDEVVYQFENDFGATTQIILNKQNVSKFWIGDNLFLKNKSKITSNSFLLLLNDGKIKLYCGYSKDYQLQGSGEARSFSYTKEKCVKVLEIDNKYYTFNSKYSLLSILPAQIKKNVKHFMRKERIKLYKSDTDQLQLLFRYLNEQIEI